MIGVIYNRTILPPFQGETNSKPSLTVPNQALSMKEILTRYTRGQEIQTRKDPQYFGEEEVPEVERMDKVEQMQFAKDLKSDVQRFKKQLEDFEKQKTSKSKSLNGEEQSDIAEGKKGAERSEDLGRKGAEVKPEQKHSTNPT